MADARVEFTAILLPGGKVLVAGGFSNGLAEDPLASAELFDSVAGTWTNTGSMLEARADFAAVVLPDGNVLVAGGATSPSVALASAELYDPSTGSWSATGAMTTARGGGSALVLDDGKVLVAGGADGNSPSDILASAELYDPASGSWTTTGSVISARATDAFVSLPDGRVLAAGGLSNTGEGLASAELYDPDTGKWELTGPMGTVRVAHTATALLDGKVLVAGGLSGGFSGDLTPSDILASAEVYDPATGSWTPTGTMSTPRFNFSAVRLLDGRVLVEAGDTLGSGPLTSSERYDPILASWTATAHVIEGRAIQIGILLPDGSVLMAGGEGPGAIGLASTEVFEP